MSTFVLFCTFVLLYFVRTVHTNFHAKSGLCSSRNERVMLNFAIWRPFCFSFFFSKFVWTVHTNFHAKSGLCSSKNERVMLNLVFGACGAPAPTVPMTNLHIELRASRQLINRFYLSSVKLHCIVYRNSFGHPLLDM